MFTQQGPPESAVVKKRVMDGEEAKEVQIPLIIPARTHWRGGARCEEEAFTLALSVGGVLLAAAVATAVVRVRLVEVADRCDPDTFNAAVGPGTCVEVDAGDVVTFDKFIKALFKGGDPAWRFKPKRPEVRGGDIVRATNTGGEVHTFTEVAAFGGGFIPPLNEPLGLTPIPECVTPAIVNPTFLPPGASLDVAGLSPGLHRFECCIHPWMRAEVTVK